MKGHHHYDNHYQHHQHCRRQPAVLASIKLSSRVSGATAPGSGLGPGLEDRRPTGPLPSSHPVRGRVVAPGDDGPPHRRRWLRRKAGDGGGRWQGRPGQWSGLLAFRDGACKAGCVPAGRDSLTAAGHPCACWRKSVHSRYASRVEHALAGFSLDAVRWVR